MKLVIDTNVLISALVKNGFTRDFLIKHIKIINPVYYSNYLEKAKTMIQDINDIPFLVCALAFNCQIWSNDRHFKKQDKIKIFTTKDMEEYII